MAPESKSHKRKAAPATAPPMKKVKKSTSTPTRKSSRIPAAEVFASGALPAEDVPEEATTTAVKPKASRKRATDFFDADGEAAEPEAPKLKKSKKSSKAAALAVDEKPAEEEEIAVASKVKPASSISKAKASKKVKSNGTTTVDTVAVEETPDEVELGSSGSEAGEDQTAALLKGFESSDDGDASHDEGFEAGKPMPALPQDKKLQKKLKGVQTGGGVEPGVVYVGRIPHGFYEHEMRDYFTQFGQITRLRLSRNPKTGASKHYAFLEFGSAEVAQIVADTMNNYLMFGHILKCQVVPKGRVHPELWKGANRRFKKVPWSKIEGRKLAAAKPRDVWEKKIDNERIKREKMAEKMKGLGYEFEAAPLKSIEDVPKREEEEETKLIEDGGADGAAEKDSAPVETSKDGEVEEGTTTVVERDAPNTLVVREEVSKDANKGKDGAKAKKEKKTKKAA